MDEDQDLAFDDEKYTTISEDLRFNVVVLDKLMRVTYSPFVLEFGAGVVEAELFSALRAQESIFQYEFARLYDIAENQVTDQKLKSAFQQLKKTAGFLPQEQKQDSHAEGFSQAAPSKYITFIRQLGQMKPVYILASLIPSMTVYRHIARKLKECAGRELMELAGSNDSFIRWISTYSSEEFCTSIKGLENLLDKLAMGATTQMVTNISRVYNRALQLVLDLFYGFSEPSLLPLVQKYQNITLVCGFHLSATKADNTAESPSSADTEAYINEDSGWSSTFFQSTTALLRTFMRNLETVDEKETNDRYERCVNVLHTAALQLCNKHELGVQTIIPIVQVAYSATNLQELLLRLSKTDIIANDELIKSKLLEGLEERDVEQFGKSFEFESPECIDFLNKFGGRANVISSCWCGANILEEAFRNVVSEEVGVYANRLCFNQGKSSGGFERNIQSADDKLQIFQRQVDKGGGLTVFVGDDISDGLCLTKANIGVIVNMSSPLLSVAPMLGLQLKPFYKGLLERVKELKSSDEVEGSWMPESGSIYTSSWRELKLCIFGDDDTLDGDEDDCLDVNDDEELDSDEDDENDEDDNESLDDDSDEQNL